MIRISDAQIKEIEANPNLLDTFLYTAGMRTREEQLADVLDQGTHGVFQMKTGDYVVMSKKPVYRYKTFQIDSNGIRITNLPWYKRLWILITSSIFGYRGIRGLKPVKKIERPAPPTIPSHWSPIEDGDRCNLEQNFDLIFYLFSDREIPGTEPLNFMLGPWCRKEKYDVGEKGTLYIVAAKVDMIIAAIDSVPLETLRKRYDDKERLVSLGCGYAAEFEGEEYDEFIGVVISDMRQFLHRVREKGDGILVLLS